MKLKLVKSIDTIFAATFLILLVSIGIYLMPSRKISSTISPNLIPREVAIDQARSAGQKTYSFSTNFVPGLGQISSMSDYQKLANPNKPLTGTN